MITRTGTIRQRNIDLPDDLYADFKAAATKRGLKLYEAFPEALELWMGSGLSESPARRAAERFRQFLESEPVDDEARELQDWLREVFSE